MPLHHRLAEKRSKIYEPSAHIGDVFKGYDISFVTNDQGEPVTLFIGTRRPDGLIAGERYVRTIKRETASAKVRSSHWDLKGVTRR
ncbi:hypothetical protein GCM10022408_32290 [Hymenobacter fastidiosus]|uniref:Uncharacterized protein n=1 Tax=Hymenobacter fastidiosus TaxID=486264 RepID=A0ABP7STP2_9BACT